MSLVQLGLIIASGAGIVLAYIKIDKALCDIQGALKAASERGEGGK